MTGRAAAGIPAGVAAVVAVACGAPEAPVSSGAPPLVAAPPAGRPAVPGCPRYVAVMSARQSAALAPRVEGALREVRVRAGDVVAAGEVVATIDDSAAREQLAMARAEVRAARASLMQAGRALRRARRMRRVERRMVRQGFSAAEEGEAAELAFVTAQADREKAAAAVEQTRVRLGQLERQLGDAALRAPFSGTVAARYRDPGALVGPGVPVVRLVDASALWVRFAVPLAEVGLLAPRSEVAVLLDGSRAVLLATVEKVAPEVDPPSQMVFVEARPRRDEARSEQLSPGGPATVLVPPAGRPARSCVEPAPSAASARAR